MLQIVSGINVAVFIERGVASTLYSFVLVRKKREKRREDRSRSIEDETAKGKAFK